MDGKSYRRSTTHGSTNQQPNAVWCECADVTESHTCPFIFPLYGARPASRSKRGENTENTHAVAVDEGYSDEEIALHYVGTDDEHLGAVAMGEAGWDIHEGEQGVRAGHGLRGSLAPVVGHQ